MTDKTNNQTGFSLWCEDNSSTTQEILILMAAEDHDPASILGASIDSCSPVPTGRDTALKGLLERGRAGQIQIPVAKIVQSLKTDESKIIETAKAIRAEWQAKYGNGPVQALPRPRETLCDILTTVQEDGNPVVMIRSDALPDLIAKLTGTAPAKPAPKSDVTPNPAQAQEQIIDTRPTKPVKKRKTKFSLNKSVTNALFAPVSDSLDTRAMRLFLLSLPDYKPQELALMTDENIRETFKSNYMAINMGGGLLVFPSDAAQTVIDALSNCDAYYIPADSEA